MKWHVNHNLSPWFRHKLRISTSTSTSVQAQLVTSVWCRMTCSSWLVTHDVSLMWPVICDSWLLTWLTTCDSSPVTCDLTCDSWHDSWLVTPDLWLLTCDSWLVTHDLWLVIHDLWLMTCDLTHDSRLVTHDLWLMVRHLLNRDLIIWTNSIHDCTYYKTNSSSCKLENTILTCLKVLDW